MKIVIDIPDAIMEYVKNNGCLSVNYDDEVAKAIINGTPYEDRPIEDLSEYSDKLWKQAYERGKAERPQGEWLEVEEEVHYDYFTVCECSLCKHSWALGELSIEDVKDDYKFCPNCGAKMTKEAENDLSI